MTALRASLGVAFALFMALSLEIVWQFGPAGFLAAVFANGATTLAMVDLTIALVMILVVMARDASRNGRTVWPYVVLTLAFGSAGPLLYFAVNLGRPSARTASEAPPRTGGRLEPAAAPPR